MTACSCLRDNLQTELDHNPVLVQRQIRVKVRHINPNEFIYLAPQSRLSQSSLCAIAKGESIAEIATRDRAAAALIDAEQTLKRRPEVKGVAWIYVGDCGVAVVEEAASIQDFTFANDSLLPMRSLMHQESSDLGELWWMLSEPLTLSVWPNEVGL